MADGANDGRKERSLWCADGGIFSLSAPFSGDSALSGLSSQESGLSTLRAVCLRSDTCVETGRGAVPHRPGQGQSRAGARSISSHVQ